jgi:protein-tyrosine sulfotransferase
MKKEPEHQGVIVLGSPRSGTTLVRRLLDAHPNIACPPETNLFSSCARFLHSYKMAEGVEVGVLNGLRFAGFKRGEVLERLREFAFGFHRDYAARAGKKRWAEKTAFDGFHIDRIEELCGDHAYFVCVVRHGLDVACSLEELSGKSGGYMDELHEYIKRSRLPLEAFAQAWVDITDSLQAFARRHPRNAVIVRYEDLVTDPEAYMSKVMGFIGEEWDADYLKAALGKTEAVGLGDWKTYGRTSIDAVSVGRWHKLSRGTQAGLARIANPTLVDCGYEEVEVEPERSDDEARRRYELGLLLQAAKAKKLEGDGKS